MIVNKAISKVNSESDAILVREDKDLLVLLITPFAHYSKRKNIIFLKLKKLHIIKHIYFTYKAQKIKEFKQSILLLHAISVCKTV